MDINFVNIIVEAIVALVGLVGGGVGIYFWRVNKQYKQAEVRDKLVEVELKESEEWNKLYKEERAKNAEKSERLRALYSTVDEQKSRILQLEFECERRNWYRCNVEGCPKRRPPHKFDENGVEIAADDPIEYQKH